MARTIRDSNLETRTARSRLKARGKPYYRTIEPGLHLGYRKPLSGAGKWVVRHYEGEQAYTVETIATADDGADADGVAILDFKQAQEQARIRMVTRAHAAVGKTGPYLVADAMEDYFEWLEAEGRTPEAIQDAKYRNHAFIDPELGKGEVAALTADRLRKWRDNLAKAQPRIRTKRDEKQKHREAVTSAGEGGAALSRARRASANRTWTVLRAALNKAFEHSKVDSDVEWRKVKPFKGVDAARPGHLSIAEAKRLINASSSDFRPLVQAALFTGARYGQLARLTAADFDPDVGTLRVSTRKGDGTVKVYHVQLTAEGAKFFAQHCAGRRRSDRLFKKDDGSAWEKSHQDRPMHEACARAKIIPALGINQLRHTYASLALKNGVDLQYVAKNFGHTDTRMVEKHYGHIRDSDFAKAIRKDAPRFGFKPDRKVTSITGPRRHLIG
jgi:integrase